MNRIFILLFAMFLISGVKAQVTQPCSTCLQEGITFTTQAQIDSFQINYPNCAEIEGPVLIFGTNITNLNGLNMLTSIWNSLKIGGWENWSHLTSLTGLDNINAGSVTNLTIRNNNSLSTCEVQSICDYLANPNGTVVIQNNASGCNSQEEIEAACDSLPLLGDITFSAQAQIDSFLVNYPICTEILGDVNISGSDIINLNGLQNITRIRGYLNISGNSALTSLAGLDQLNTIDGGLMFCQNDALNSLSGLENLTTIGGDLKIGTFDMYSGGCGNQALVSLTGLNSLTRVGESLIIQYNESLLSLEGLNGLTAIDSSLCLDDNDALTNLTALSGMTYLGVRLWIAGNQNITFLTGLENIDAGSVKDIAVYNNASLSSCNVQSICDYLKSQHGTVDIHDNASGCNSKEEVDALCREGIDESSVVSCQLSVSIYPNPSSATITIELPEPTPGFQISIFNFSGQEVINRHITGSDIVIDISQLPQGIYFVRVADDRTVHVGKFVKK